MSDTKIPSGNQTVDVGNTTNSHEQKTTQSTLSLDQNNDQSNQKNVTADALNNKTFASTQPKPIEANPVKSVNPPANQILINDAADNLMQNKAVSSIAQAKISSSVAPQDISSTKKNLDAPQDISSTKKNLDAPQDISSTKNTLDAPQAISSTKNTLDAPQDISSTKKTLDAPQDISSTKNTLDAPQDISSTKKNLDAPQDISSTKKTLDAPQDISSTKNTLDAPQAISSTKNTLDAPSNDTAIAKSDDISTLTQKVSMGSASKPYQTPVRAKEAVIPTVQPAKLKPVTDNTGIAATKQASQKANLNASTNVLAKEYDGPYIELMLKKVIIKSKIFSLNPFKSTRVLSDVKFALPKGRKLLIVGENGAGKSTLLRTIMGFNHVSGKVKVKGINPVKNQIAALKEIAYSSDHYHLPPDYEVEELLELISFFNPNFILPLAKLFLEKTQLKYANKLTHQLSKGMETMLRNTIVLANNADIALFDEPTLGVDPVQKLTFINELTAKAKANPNYTYIITTHTPNDVCSVVDDVMFMFRGTISPKIPIASINRLFVGYVTKQIRKNSNAIGEMIQPKINSIKQIFWKTQAPPEANEPVSIEELYSIISNNANLMETMKTELEQIGNL